jgi:hypothetical protein
MADRKGGKNRKKKIIICCPKLADAKGVINLASYIRICNRHLFSVRYLVFLRPKYFIISVSTDLNVVYYRSEEF